MRLGSVALGALVLLLGAGAALAASGWDPRDVEAADRYRAAERERAERYRAEIERGRGSRVVAKQTEPAPETRRRAPEGRSERRDRPAWVDRVLDEVTEPFDREAIAEFVEEVESWVAWWEAEVAPHLHHPEHD